MKKEITKKAGIWFLAFVLFMAHLFFRSLAHAGEGSEWTQIYAKGGDWYIAFPSTPQKIQQSLKLPDSDQPLHYDMYLAPFENKGIFLFLVATHPLPPSPGREIAGLEGFLKGIVGHHPDNRLVFARFVMVGKKPAIDFLVESKARYFRGQVLMVGNRLFLIAMEVHQGKVDEKVFARFAESFQFVQKP